MYIEEKYVVGVDFGSDSVRAAVVAISDGSVAGSGVAYYPRWKEGLYQHPERNIFRQHPLDYLESFEKCVIEALSCLSREARERVVGIGVDTTGSTPVPVNREGVPLALTEGFETCENAMFYLWKDHSAAGEAEEIDRAFSGGSRDYGKYQGRYSAEWFWAKILHAVRTDVRIREAAYTWTEHCDWMVGSLCGRTRPEEIYHSACAAGQKALWHSEWNGLPDAEILGSIDPYLALVRERYGNNPAPAVTLAGHLTGEWAEKLGLPQGICVSGSSFDAHAGAVGAGIREKTIVCTLGTSAVDMLVETSESLQGKEIRRFGGAAEHSILPGYVGIETGQAAFGDIFGWFKRVLLWPLEQSGRFLDPETYHRLCQEMDDIMLAELQRQAGELQDDIFPIALDWFNGRRYPDTDDSRRAVIGGLALGAQAPCIFRALVFGAVCGLKRIVDGFEKAELVIEKVVAVGGISKKSAYVMQMMADVLGKQIEILDADQTCALGAAIYAAVASGAHKDVHGASAHMAAKCVGEFKPDETKTEFYREQYQKYLRLAQLADVWEEG